MNGEENKISMDFIGVGNHYYTQSNSDFFHSTNLEEILEHAELNLDRRALKSYFAYGYVPTGYTLIKNVHRIPPGHTLEYENGEKDLWKYWDLTWNIQGKPEKWFLERIKRNLREEVKEKVEGDEEIGALISGGLDSTIVLSLLSEFVEDLKTFSVGFGGLVEDELSQARKISKFYETDHFEIDVADVNVNHLEEILRHFENPFSDPAVVPVYKAMEKARGEGVDKIFVGSGSDELFFGYAPPNILYPFTEIIPRIFKGFFSAFTGLFGANTKAKRALSLISSKNPYEQYALKLVDDDLDELMGTEVERYGLGHRFPEKLNHHNRSYHYRIKEPLPNMLIPKNVASAKANSLSVEAPFLNKDLVDLALQIPVKLKVRNGMRKYILRKAFKEKIPQEVFEREARGFGPPREEWLTKTGLGEQLKEFIEESDHSYYNKSFALDLFDSIERNARTLWSILIFEMWYRMFVQK